MSNIDYTQFYLKNYMADKKTIKNVSVIPKQKKSKKGVCFFVMTVILISVLLYANFFMEDFTFAKIKNVFTKDKTEHYYMLIKSFDDRDKAYAQSLLIRQSGAAGYIYQDSGKYKVIYTVFLSESDANQVAKKNSSTEVINKTIKNNDFYKKISSALEQIIKACEQLENAEIYEAQLLEITSVIKTQLETQKAGYLNDSDDLEYAHILEVFIGGLSSLHFPSPTRVSLLSDLRYVVSSVIMSC